LAKRDAEPSTLPQCGKCKRHLSLYYWGRICPYCEPDADSGYLTVAEFWADAERDMREKEVLIGKSNIPLPLAGPRDGARD
jgi:hypothetical protein